MAMAAPPPSCHLLHLLHSQPASSLPSISLLKPILLSSTITITPTFVMPKTESPPQMQIPPNRKTLFASTTCISDPFLRHAFSWPASSVPRRHFAALGVGDVVTVGDEEIGIEDDDGDTLMGVDSDSSPLERNREGRLKLPSLSVKEKKELASYAHSLGKKLKSQLVGKSGVTSNVATSFIETLEANELLKIKIHRTCPGELEDVVKQLEEATGSVTVGQIGRTVIVYRPSLTKLKAEEKKKQTREVFLRKQLKSKVSKIKESKISPRRSSWKQ